MWELIERFFRLPVSFLLYLLLLLVDCALGLVFYKQLPKAFRLLTQLILLTFLFEFLGILSIQTGVVESNFSFYHVLQPIQLLYIGSIYFNLFRQLRLGKNHFFSVSIFLSMATVAISIFYQTIQQFPAYGSLILSLFVVISSLYLYIKMIQLPIEVPILTQGQFWLNSGNFFFYAVTFLTFGYFEYVQALHNRTPEWVMFIIKTSNFILYSFYGIALYFAHQNCKHGRV